MPNTNSDFSVACCRVWEPCYNRHTAQSLDTYVNCIFLRQTSISYVTTGSVCVCVQEMTGLECGHKFCAKCWAEYLTSKIIDEGMGQTISCAAFGCDILVDDATVM